MATVKEVVEVVTPAPVSLGWIAVIYSPHKEKIDGPGELGLIAGLPSVQRKPACRHFQLPPHQPPGWKAGQALESRTIQINPGTNLGISATDWQLLLDADAAKVKRGEIPSLGRLIERGAIETAIPDIDVYGEPGFRHFSPASALKLISLTAHEDWLDKWGQFETRPEILKAIGEARAKIIEIKRKAAA